MHNFQRSFNENGHLAPVVQKVEKAIHCINLYPTDSAIAFPNTNPVDSDLSGGLCCPAFEQLGPELSMLSL